MRLSITCLLVSSLTIAPGCSLFVSSTQPVTIAASDPHAQIAVDGNPVGTGSAQVQLKRNHPHQVTAKAGDRSGSALIDRKISFTGVLDLIGCFWLVPLLGTTAPGFWRLDPEHLSVPLHPATAPIAGGAGGAGSY